MRKTIEIDLEYQPTIPAPPVAQEELYGRAASGDKVTVDSWRDIWIKNYKACNEKFGDFGAHTFGKLHGINRHKAAICLASGPSLRDSFDALRRNQMQKNPVMVVSALHNYALLKDEGIKVDYWLTMDGGDIVMDDTTELGTKDKDYYWESTKDEKLIALTFSPPSLWEKWKGKIYLCNALMPDPELKKQLDDIQKFSHYLSSGGNVGGGVVYVAKVVFGSQKIMFCGYDFCFDYDLKFHPVATKYDNFNGKGIGVTIPWVDVYGMPRRTWGSYLNFKFWFDWLVSSIPGDWVSCSGGLLGAYKEGNIAQLKYMPLKDALIPYWIADEVKVQERGGSGESRPLDLTELFADAKHQETFTMF